MIEIKQYNSASSYLVATEQVLELRELENNLLLGQSRKFVQNFSNNSNHLFINCFKHGEIKCSAIKNNDRAILGSISEDREAIQILCEYFVQNNVDVKGVVGEKILANIFAENYQKEIDLVKPLVVYQLEKIGLLDKPNGHFELATMDDLPTITLWENLFQKEVNLLPILSEEQLKAANIRRIKNNEVYKWIINDEIVSMAAKIRSTKNIGFIGNVYTPNNHRGKGFATACVHQLSELMLKSGYKACGLFADQNNSSSNKIYQRIGYHPGPEFSDIHFK